MNCTLFAIVLICFVVSLLHTVVANQQQFLERPVGNGTESSPSLTCRDIYHVKRAVNESFEAGVYILYTNSSPRTYRAFCRDDGGTLVLRLRSQSRIFAFNSSFWYDSSLLNHESFDENVEAKYPSYQNVPTNSISIHFQITTPSPRNRTGSLTISLQHIPNLAHILSTREFIPFNLSTPTIHSRQKWAQLLPEDYAFQLGCNREGFNVEAGLGGGLNTSIFAKIGFYANENSPTDCSSCNSGFVIGSSYDSLDPITRASHYHGQFNAGEFDCPFSATSQVAPCKTIGGIVSIYANENYDCSSLNFCNGRGRCVANNTCRCEVGYPGEACQISSIPSVYPTPYSTTVAPIPIPPVNPNTANVDPETAAALAIVIPVGLVLLLLCCAFGLVIIIVIVVIATRMKRKKVAATIHLPSIVSPTNERV